VLQKEFLFFILHKGQKKALICGSKVLAVHSERSGEKGQFHGGRSFPSKFAPKSPFVCIGQPLSFTTDVSGRPLKVCLKKTRLGGGGLNKTN